MKYDEKNMDLFDTPFDYVLVHCISADFKLGAGIAAKINVTFNVRNKLKIIFPNYLEKWVMEKKTYDCLACPIDFISYETTVTVPLFNLVTKTRYYDKPTYESLSGSLYLLKEYCMNNNIKKIAMPRIGCGLDKLKWNKVSKIIQETFKDTDIEILVCIYP